MPSKASGVVWVAVLLLTGVPQAQQSTFRSGVDLVVLDVQVVDGTGQPRLGLGPSAFDVRIDGRRRQVVAADVLRYSSDSATGPLGAPAAGNSFADSPGTPGRTFVIAVDSMSLSSGDGAGVVRAAHAFVNGLTPSDRIGVAMLPRGVSLGPTENHDAAHRALNQIVGLGALRPNQFHLSVSEVIDIVAESEQSGLSQMNLGRGGRGTVATAPGDVLQGVQTRECPSGQQGCTQGLVLDAAMQVHQMEADLAESLGGIRRLLALLREYPGRKTVVLISGGMPVNDGPGGWQHDGDEELALGRDAALSSSTVYAIYLDSALSRVNSTEHRSPRSVASAARDRQVQQRVLDVFASASGGALLTAPVDTGEASLRRILRETSTFYTLAVIPDPKDLDGRPHQLKVNLSPKGLTLRVPRYVVLRRGQ